MCCFIHSNGRIITVTLNKARYILFNNSMHNKETDRQLLMMQNLSCSTLIPQIILLLLNLIPLYLTLTLSLLTLTLSLLTLTP